MTGRKRCLASGSSRKRLRRATLLASLALLAAGPAGASPATLRRALGDIVFAPFDVALSPVTAGIATAQNFGAVGHSPVEPVVYAVPGYAGLTVLQAGVGVLRAVSGLLQVVPGLFLLPFDADIPERFDYFSRGRALADLQNPLATDPAWLSYAFPLTFFTLDVKAGIVSPYGLYTPPEAHPSAPLATPTTSPVPR